MRLKLAASAAFVTALLVLAPPLTAQLGDTPWPMRGHDARRTGRSEVNGPHTAHLKWKLYLGGEWGVTGDPIIAKDGTIYVGASTRALYAVNPDGTEKWRFDTIDKVVGAPAIGADGTIYLPCYDKRLYALNPDGTLKWTLEGVGYVAGTPAIGEDGSIYFGSMNNRMYAVSPEGEVKWTFQAAGDVDAGPAIGLDGTLYFGSWDKSFYAVWPDGKLRWSMYIGSTVPGLPAVGDDGTVYFGEKREFLYAVTADGQIRWKCSLAGGAERSVVVAQDGTIYGGGTRLYALSPEGEQLWWFRPELDAGVSEAIGATTPDGIVYFGSFDHCLYALHSSGQKVWSYETGDMIYGAPAIAADGTLYTASADGYLYAFGVIPEEGAWIAIVVPALGIGLRTVRRR